MKSYLAIAWWEQVELLQKPFFKDWQAFTNSNSKPRIGPKARASFDYGTNNVTAQRYDEALDVKSKFTEWWSEVVNPADEESVRNSVVPLCLALYFIIPPKLQLQVVQAYVPEACNSPCLWLPLYVSISRRIIPTDRPVSYNDNDNY